eukprot:786908-Prymnesium_polylepis.1
MDPRNGSSFPAAGRFRFRARVLLLAARELGQNVAVLEWVGAGGRETCFLTPPYPPSLSSLRRTTGELKNLATP